MDLCILKGLGFSTSTTPATTVIGFDLRLLVHVLGISLKGLHGRGSLRSYHVSHGLCSRRRLGLFLYRCQRRGLALCSKSIGCLFYSAYKFLLTSC